MTEPNRAIGKLMLRGDHEHLGQRIRLLPNQKQEPARQHYKRLFLEAMDKEPVEQKKANAGRRAANLWLSGYV